MPPCRTRLPVLAFGPFAPLAGCRGAVRDADFSLPSGKVIDTGAACVVVDVVAPVEGHPGDGLCHVSIYCETLLTLYFRGRMRGALPPPASRGNRPSVKHSNIPGQCPLRCCDVAHRAVSVCVGFGAYRGARPLLSLNLSRVPGAGP